MDQLSWWIQTILYLIFIGIVLYQVQVLKVTLKAQKDAMAAQTAAVSAQQVTLGNLSNLLGTMDTVLSSVDAPKMLARYEAYKKILEEEKEAAIRQGDKMALYALDKCKEEIEFWTRSCLNISYSLLPYVPPFERMRIIDSFKLENHEDFRQFFYKLQEWAPDFSTKENRKIASAEDLLAQTIRSNQPSESQK